MSEYTLDTDATPTHVVVLNGHRYHIIGITRSIHRAASEKQAAAIALRERMESAPTEELPDLEDQAARMMIDVAAMRLRPENGAEPASDLLARLWDDDRLEIDRHLDPLLKHLYGEETAPVPPA